MRPLRVDKRETLQDAFQAASDYWASKGASSRMMSLRAERCVKLIGSNTRLDQLGPHTGTTLLTHLQGAKLSKATVQANYAAFKRMLTLAGVATATWPSAGSPPRRVREPIAAGDVERLRLWMIERGWQETADLIEVLRGTGMRVDVEALSFDNWDMVGPMQGLRITGKGGHERWIPVQDDLRVRMWNKDRMDAMRRLSYAAHLKRWNMGVRALGITSRLPTPHAVRHLYATEAYNRSGRNLKAVQELLGHADIATTARYIGVDEAELRRAAGCTPEREGQGWGGQDEGGYA